MQDHDKSKEQLLHELKELRQRVEQLETLNKKQQQQRNFDQKQIHALPFQIMTNLSDAIFITDDQGKFTYVSPLASTIFNYSDQEIWQLGDIYQLLGEAFFDFEQLKTNNEISNLEIKIRTKEDKIRDFLITIKKVSINKGTILYICRDISERKKMAKEEEAHRNRMGKLIKEQTIDLINTNIELQEEISDREQVEKELQKNEKRLTQIIDLVPHLIYAKDQDNRYILVNKVLADSLGTTTQDLQGQLADEEQFASFHKSNEAFFKLDQKVIENNKPLLIPEQPFTDHQGHNRFYQSAKIPYNLSAAQEKAMLCVSVDISKIKETEKLLKASLNEHKRLLKKSHQQISTNLTLISGIIRLSYKKLNDVKYTSILKGCENRIKSIGLVHELLYQADDLTKIDCQQYIKRMLQQLQYSYGIDENKVALTLNIVDIYLQVDKAILCGLIINELASNSLKYAFPDKVDGELMISLRFVDDLYELIISDKGAGLPERIQLENSGTLGLGLSLAVNWINQLQGNIRLSRIRGTKYQLTFK